MPRTLEEILEESKKVFFVENSHIPLAELEEQWERKVHRVRSPTPYVAGREVADSSRRAVERPIGHGEYESSVISEKGLRAPSPPADRWAQIRKTAAERAGRISDDQKARESQDETEDREESGEESMYLRISFLSRNFKMNIC